MKKGFSFFLRNSLFIEVHLFSAFLKARKISRKGHFTLWFLAFDFIIIALLKSFGEQYANKIHHFSFGIG